MPAKKLSKLEQEKAEAEAVEKAALDKQAAEAAAAAASLDALFTYDTALVVPQHDDADIAAVLKHHFHHLYFPKPVPSPPAQPAAEQVTAEPPPQPNNKGKAAAKATKPPSKKQAAAAVPEPPPPVEPLPVQAVARGEGHPISVLERRWRAEDERHGGVERELLAASAAYASQQREAADQLHALQLLPAIDMPHPPAVPLALAAPLLAAERLLDLSVITAAATEALLARQRPVVRRLPVAERRPGTRGAAWAAAAAEAEAEQKEQLMLVKPATQRRHARRRVAPGEAVLSDRQRVQRELNRIAIAPSQLEAEQRVLRRMREKARYLPNPRSQHAAPQPAATQPRHARGLEADVTDIRFVRYDGGERYERAVRLTNTSRLTQRISLNQPAVGSPFAYTLSSAAAAAQLAPGMSVSVLVSFAPLSLASSTAVLVVRTEHAVLHIPIVAQRLPSPLSLPPTIALPACLMQRTVVQSIEVQNSGLRSTFRLLPAGVLDAPPPADQLPSTLQLSDALSVYPAVFELDEGDSITLTFTFAPTTANAASASSSPLTAAEDAKLLYTYSSVLGVATDDDAVSYHTVTGEACELAMQLVTPAQQPAAGPQTHMVKPRAPFLFGIELLGLTADSAAGASSPSFSADRLVFPSTLLGSSSALSVTLRNLSPVSLPFEWLTPFDDRYSSLLPVFHCYPPNGTLLGREEREVVVTFTPRAALTPYTHSLQLLCNAPGHADLSLAELAVHGQGRAGRLGVAVEGGGERRAVVRGEWEAWQLRLCNDEAAEVEMEYEVEAAVMGGGGGVEAARVQLWPSQGRVGGGRSRVVSVNVQSEECGVVVVEVKLTTHPGGQSSTLQLTADVVEQLPQTGLAENEVAPQLDQALDASLTLSPVECDTPSTVDIAPVEVS